MRVNAVYLQKGDHWFECVCLPALLPVSPGVVCVITLTCVLCFSVNQSHSSHLVPSPSLCHCWVIFIVAVGHGWFVSHCFLLPIPLYSFCLCSCPVVTVDNSITLFKFVL